MSEEGSNIGAARYDSRSAGQGKGNLDRIKISRFVEEGGKHFAFALRCGQYCEGRGREDAANCVDHANGILRRSLRSVLLGQGLSCVGGSEGLGCDAGAREWEVAR